MKTLKLTGFTILFMLFFFTFETMAQKNHWGGNVEFGYPSVVGREFLGGPRAEEGRGVRQLGLRLVFIVSSPR